MLQFNAPAQIFEEAVPRRVLAFAADSGIQNWHAGKPKMDSFR
jgi:hypothetical protein